MLVFLFGKTAVFADSGAEVENVANKSVVRGINNLKGFFVGVDVAYNHSSATHAPVYAVVRDANDEQIIGSNELHSKYKHKRVRIDPSFNVGYSRFFNNWGVALAVDVSFGKSASQLVTVSKDPFDEGYEAKISGVSYAVKAKGGYCFSKLNSVVYGIAGVKWREVRFRNFLQDNFSSKAKLGSPSFLLGLGFEKPICKKLSVSAEYEYSWRNSSGSTRLSDVNFVTDVDVKQRLREHVLKIGVKYHI